MFDIVDSMDGSQSNNLLNRYTLVLFPRGVCCVSTKSPTQLYIYMKLSRLHNMYLPIYNFVRSKGVWFGKTQYLPTSFARKLLQGSKYTVEWFLMLAYLLFIYNKVFTSDIVIMIMLELLIEVSNCQWHRYLYHLLNKWRQWWS